MYCSLKHKGGGATRVAEHLGGIVGNVRSCPNVPRNVRDAMRECRDESRRKKRDKQNSRLRIERNIMEGLYKKGGVVNVPDDEEEEIQMNIREALRDPNVSRRVERRIGRGAWVMCGFLLAKGVSLPILTNNYPATKYLCSPRSVVLWILIQEMHLV